MIFSGWKCSRYHRASETFIQVASEGFLMKNFVDFSKAIVQKYVYEHPKVKVSSGEASGVLIRFQVLKATLQVVL